MLSASSGIVLCGNVRQAHVFVPYWLQALCQHHFLSVAPRMFEILLYSIKTPMTLWPQQHADCF